ncbi:MAG: hypothetical protein K2H07_00100, partial [Lachnospiraceae bacterium]|nr:hypothetical protein [Lachnospiraceae bacterium]
MKKIKSTLILSATLLTLSLALAGCGNDQTSKDNAGSNGNGTTQSGSNSGGGNNNNSGGAMDDAKDI